MAVCAGFFGGVAAGEDAPPRGRPAAIFDFEPREGPGNQYLGPQGWRYLFDPLRGVDYPVYLQDRIRLLPDPAATRPGLYSDRPGIVMEIPFDGTRVGVKTRAPIPAPPGPAYALSVHTRDEGLARSRVHLTVQWLSTRDGEERILRQDKFGDIPTGQIDWPEAPAERLIREPPPGANAAHLILEIENDPGESQGVARDRHGLLWIDDLALLPRPRLTLPPSTRFAPAGPPGSAGALGVNEPRVVFPLRLGFHGLPFDPENTTPRFTRLIEVFDLDGLPPRDGQGRPLPQPFAARRALAPVADGSVHEEIEAVVGAFGVYYIGLRLLDASGYPVAALTQTLTLMPDTPGADGAGYGGDGNGAPKTRREFGLRLDHPPAALLAESGAIASWLRRAGALQVKFDVWTADFRPGDEPGAYLRALTREARSWRGAGARLTGVFTPAPYRLQARDLAEMLRAPEELKPWIEGVMPLFGSLVDAWQWGRDDDASMENGPPPEAREAAERTLAAVVGGVPQNWPIALNPSRGGRDASAPTTYASTRPGLYSLHAPLPLDADGWLSGLARRAPWTLDGFGRDLDASEPERYPAAVILDAARAARTLRAASTTAAANAANAYSDESAIVRTGGAFSFSPPPAPSFPRSASAERAQLEALMQAAVLAKVIGTTPIYAASLTHPTRGLLAGPSPVPAGLSDDDAVSAATSGGGGASAWQPRPAFLGLATLTSMLEGTRYIGSFRLPPPTVAHVFQRPRTDECVVALWSADASAAASVERLDLAEGPRLILTDWAGNRRPFPEVLTPSGAPVFVTGLPATLALTRLSVDIADDPPLRGRLERQRQDLVITNHATVPLPFVAEPWYAVRLDGSLLLEPDWRVEPARVSGNLPAASAAGTTTVTAGTVAGTGNAARPRVRTPFFARPDPDSLFYSVGEGGRTLDASRKLVRLRFEWRGDPPVRMTLYRDTRLESEIEMRIVPLVRPERPDLLTLQLRLRYFPDVPTPPIEIRPYAAVSGEPPMRAARLRLTPRPLEARGDPRADFDSTELVLRLERPVRPTIVGFDEEGGRQFMRVDITPLLRSLGE